MKNLFQILLLIGLTLFACKPQQPSESSVDLLSKYISSRGPANISVKDEMMIRFKVDIPEEKRSQIADFITISPKADFSCKWNGDHELLIYPGERLGHGKPYSIIINTKALFDSNDDDIVIGFNTHKLSIHCSLDNLTHTYDGTNELTKISGEIESSDDIAKTTVINAFKVDQKNNADLSVEWTGKDEGRLFGFTVNGIKRFEETSKLDLSYDLTNLDDYAKFDKTIEIHPIRDFVYSELVQEKFDASYVTLVFSRALDKGQNLDGLIKSKSGDFKYKSEIVDNVINVYPESNVAENFEIIISEHIKDFKGEKLPQSYSEKINLVLEKPEVKLLGSGVISPMQSELVFPFQAKNLDAVDVEIFKIYENNVLQFLQYNRLDNTYAQREVGKIVYQDSIPLNRTVSNQFESFYLDLKNMVVLDPAAIYQIRIGFRQHYAVTNCDTPIVYSLEKNMTKTIMTSYRRYEGFRWEHRNDPCYPAYYGQDKFVSRNLLGSNLAIIAKKSPQNRIHVKLIDFTSATEISGADIKVYNFQQQLLSESKTQSGTSDFSLNEKADFIIANYNNQFAYLKLQDYDALSMTNFDVGGRSKQNGVDGFIYSERGVWRPGDTMFISFILENPELVITQDYPIKISVNDSRGTKRYSETSTNHSGGLYVFKVPTEHTDPTGNWNATIIVGENKFYKSLKLETIKPNRLKIDVVQEGKGEIDISNGRSDFQFSSNWLHGSPAKNLRAKVECQFTQRSLSFKDHPDYNFMDYTAGLDSRVFTGFDAKLNEKGEGQFSLKRPPTNTIKSKLTANFKIRVFEESGNTSEDHFSIGLNPFSHYAGISLAKTSWYSQSYGLGSKQTFKVLSVDKSGKTSSSRKLSVGVYKNSDYWWYRQNARNNYSYANGKHVGATHEFDLTTDGQGEGEVKFDCKDAGSFTIRVCDSETGHCSSSRFYVRNYYDDTELSYENRTEISKIFLSADKDDYNTGETAQIKIPSYLGAKILVSLETQDRILFQEWIEGKDKETIYSLRCTQDMAPNVYVNVNIIQAHGQSVNNMPIRMYGVLPIKVYNKKTKLIPEIEMADVIEPLEKYNVTISEENDREMHYTLAVVDEGLLDLTNYNTPDPFNHFYAKQSLLLKTWDNFDMILNGFGSELSRVLSIGGDGESAESKPPKKANRFKPVVSFLGPYHLKAGKKVKHELTMDNYVGSVKVMIVARDKSSFGKADKQVPVKKPLMILATAPRVIGPEEQFTLPVNVFAMDSKIRDVEVTVETDEQFSIIDGSNKTVSFKDVGDQLVNFNLSVKDLVGIGKIKITARSGAELMTQEMEIDIRNPNPYISDVLDKVIAPESEWGSSFVLIGVEGTNEAVLELSTFPAIDFDRRLKYLIRYPYGCLEQTTSSAFPQLFMENVVELTDAQKKQMQYNVEKAIRRIGKYKLSDGSLSYWIGENRRANWAFTYAVHFLIEAKKSGYYVPNDLIDEAVIALKKEVKTLDINALWSKREKGNYWSSESSFYQMHFTNQAYSLYVLSLVNEAVFPAMNLLNAENKLNRTASAFLAGAYQNSGKSSIASELLTKHSEGSWYEPYHNYSYGSELRNKSVACLVLNNMDRKEEAAKLAIQIANSLGSTRWYSTQSTAFGLMAVSKFLGKSEREPLNFVVDLGNGQQKTISTDKPVFHYKLDQKELEAKKVFVKNLNKNNLFSRLILSGQPAKNINESYEKGLSMSVAYKDENGLSLNPAEITQGLDFYAYVTIKNKSNRSYLNNLALSQVFPSGWEIMNTRMDKFTEEKDYRLRYQDFRDDRVYSFFNLGSQSVTIKLKLNASYPGEYYLPDLFCEAMYDNEIQARIAGKKVRVLPRLN